MTWRPGRAVLSLSLSLQRHELAMAARLQNIVSYHSAVVAAPDRSADACPWLSKPTCCKPVSGLAHCWQRAFAPSPNPTSCICWPWSRACQLSAALLSRNNHKGSRLLLPCRSTRRLRSSRTGGGSRRAMSCWTARRPSSDRSQSTRRAVSPPCQPCSELLRSPLTDRRCAAQKVVLPPRNTWHYWCACGHSNIEQALLLAIALVVLPTGSQHDQEARNSHQRLRVCRRQPFIELGVFVVMVLGFYAYMHWRQVRSRSYRCEGFVDIACCPTGSAVGHATGG